MRVGRVASGALAALLIQALAGCPGPDPVGEVEPPEHQPVETVVIHPTEFREWIETTGVIEAPEDARLAAEVPGTILRVASEGRSVTRGEVVGQLDPGVAQAALEQAQAAVADSRAALEQAEDAFRRQEPLLRDTIISPMEFEGIRIQRDQARARLNQVLAQEREARERLEQYRVRAPFDGIVEEQFVRTGEQVVAGQEVIRVMGDRRIEVMAGIPERFAGDIGVGSSARIQLRTYGIEDLEASIDFVGRAVHPQSRTFSIRIDLSDPPEALKAGMIARVFAARRVLPEALVLPLGAILRDEEDASVLVVEPLDEAEGAGEAAGADRAGDSSDGPRGIIHLRTLVLGPRYGGDVVAEEGLEPGEEVVVVGQEEVAPGDTVVIARRYSGLPAFRAAMDGNAPRP